MRILRVFGGSKKGERQADTPSQTEDNGRNGRKQKGVPELAEAITRAKLQETLG